MGIELVEDKTSKVPLGAAGLRAVLARCGRDGLIVGGTTNTAPGFTNVVILAPPLVLDEEESDQLASTLERAIREELTAKS